MGQWLMYSSALIPRFRLELNPVEKPAADRHSRQVLLHDTSHSAAPPDGPCRLKARSTW